MTKPAKHHIRKYATEARVDGRKVGVYVFSCGPCNIYNKSFETKSARDRAAATHEKTGA